ncbi:hypothetical protein OY671_008181, partial [Metschnikowia pulcherrima]
ITAPASSARAAASRSTHEGAGAIVNVASVLASAPEMFDGAYSGSKAFISNSSQGSATESAGSGVHVQAVLPGATRTEIWERSGKDVDAFPAEMVMDVNDSVDAASVGLDRGENVTIPPSADSAGWEAMQSARRGRRPLSRGSGSNGTAPNRRTSRRFGMRHRKIMGWQKLTKMHRTILASACAVASIPSGATAHTVVRAGKLIDGTGAPPRENVSIVVDGDRIVEVREGFAPIAQGDTSIDSSNRTVSPGSIDMHVHITVTGYKGDPIR